MIDRYLNQLKKGKQIRFTENKNEIRSQALSSPSSLFHLFLFFSTVFFSTKLNKFGIRTTSGPWFHGWSFNVWRNSFSICRIHCKFLWKAFRSNLVIKLSKFSFRLKQNSKFKMDQNSEVKEKKSEASLQQSLLLRTKPLSHAKK